MNRKTAIITTTFAVLAMSSCSALRQIDRIDRGGDTPAPTTTVIEPVTVISTPDCEDLQSGACLPCDGMADCASNVPSGTNPADLSDCNQAGLEVGVCEPANGVSD